MRLNPQIHEIDIHDINNREQLVLKLNGLEIEQKILPDKRAVLYQIIRPKEFQTLRLTYLG